MLLHDITLHGIVANPMKKQLAKKTTIENAVNQNMRLGKLKAYKCRLLYLQFILIKYKFVAGTN